MQTHWGQANLALNHIRKTLSCALVGNYSVVTGTVEEGEGVVEFLFFEDGTPRKTNDGKNFSLFTVYFSQAMVKNLFVWYFQVLSCQMEL